MDICNDEAVTPLSESSAGEKTSIQKNQPIIIKSRNFTKISNYSLKGK